jgi:hypothetical protein
MSNYTEKMVAEMEAKGSFTFDEAVAFAEANGLKVRSVISKVRSLGLPYSPKPSKVTKTGEPVIPKASFVEQIATVVGEEMPSLEKATKADLEKLANFLNSLQ